MHHLDNDRSAHSKPCVYKRQLQINDNDKLEVEDEVLKRFDIAN